MQDSTDTRREEIRTQIARMRRRVDRGVSRAAQDVMQLTPFSRMVSRRGGGWGLLGAGLAFALSRWVFRHPASSRWERGLLGSAMSFGVEQLLRRLRILAWQSRRRRAQSDVESGDE